MKTCNFLVVDDHQLFADGLSRILQEETEFNAIGIVNSGEELLDFLDQTIPDLILLDIQLKNVSGIKLCAHIHNKFPEIKIVLISMIQAPHLIMEAEKIGANGYLPKTTDAQLLKDTIKKIWAGEDVYIGALNNHTVNDKKELLSIREMEIIHLIKNGMTSKAIADKLFLSPYTVETHRKNILRKLNLNSAHELVAYAYENHL